MSEPLEDRKYNELVQVLAVARDSIAELEATVAAFRTQKPSEPVSTFTIVSGAQMFFSTPHLGHLPAGEYAVFALAAEEDDE